jgi:hypothetical protein
LKPLRSSRTSMTADVEVEEGSDDIRGWRFARFEDG